MNCCHAFNETFGIYSLPSNTKIVCLNFAKENRKKFIKKQFINAGTNCYMTIL